MLIEYCEVLGLSHDFRLFSGQETGNILHFFNLQTHNKERVEENWLQVCVVKSRY